ncbi:hypothetical protein GUJ93_ZPchr0006g43220 [Zizania palustris]|uniref:CASP-like protein n=1 Tax=Zizania palustris TaxID=103762 RepID=A0A8J5TA18_ZIZPA|nr:hypothetical protein GUJ93_ZPchr0006g43220 [Zizania palustris]
MRQAGAVSPGNVPVCYYGSGGRVPASLERRVRAAEVLLRCAACGLAVLAAALLGADRQTRVFFSIQKVARYTDMQSLVLLVIANGMAACYSLIQCARCLVSIVRGGVLVSRPLAWAIFSCDQASIAVNVAISFASHSFVSVISSHVCLLLSRGDFQFQL